MSRGRRTLAVTVGLLVLAGPAAVAPVSLQAGAQAVGAQPVGARADAALDWSPVTRLAPNPQGAALAVDGRGTVTAVWATSSWPHRVVAARRAAGGTWGEPQTLGRGHSPVVAADARGRVTVAWLSQRSGYTDGVLAARRPVGGPWSDPVRLTRDRTVPGYPHDGESPYGAVDVDLAVNARGAAVAAWAWGSDDRDVPWRVQAAVRPVAGPWRAAQDVTPASGARFPQLGIAADRTATVLYGRQPFGHPQQLLARRWRVGSGWTRPTVVAAEGYAHTVAVDRAGNAVVAFSPDFSSVRAAYRPADGRWRRPARVSPAGAQVDALALAMNISGRALLAMGRSNGRVDVVERTPRTSWTDPAMITARGEPVCEVLPSLNDAGDTFVGWGCYALLGTYRPAGGSWSDQSTISPDSGVEVLESASAVVAPDRDVTVLWDQEELPLKVRVLDVP
jgi:hypothetical protein